ncbi:MAG: mechanosensitive ion channel [Gammaproteobacteria bacterium]|nr:mechanosensitive ion channel [Gammaproteobacteria bacterium]
MVQGIREAGYIRAGRHLLAAFLVVLVLTTAASAEKASLPLVTNPAAGLLKAGDVQAQIDTLESSGDGSAQSRSNLEDYKSALDLMRDAEADRVISDKFQQLVDGGAGEIELARKVLESTLNQQVNVPEQDLDLTSLEQQLDRELSAYRELNKKLSERESTQVAQRLRPDQVITELAKAKIELGKLDIEQRSRVDEPEGSESEPRRSLAQSKRKALDARVNRLELERLSYRPRMDLLDLQIRETRARLEKLEQFLEALRHRINQLRSEEAEKERQAAEQMQVEASSKHPLIQQEVDRNSALGLELEDVVRDIEQGQKGLSLIASGLDRVKHNMDRFQQKLGTIDLDREQSDLLRTQRRELPDLRKLKRDLDSRQQQTMKIRIDAFKLEDQRQAVAEQMATDTLNQLRPADVSDSEWHSIRKELKSIFALRLTLLVKLRDGLDRYERVLGDINLEQQQLIDTAGGYGELLDRHLAWMPSTRSFDFTSIVRIAEQLFDLVSHQHRQDLIDLVVKGLTERFVPVMLVLLMFLLLIALKSRMKWRLAQIAPKVGKVAQDNYWLTPAVMLVTLLLALPAPLFLLLLALVESGATATGFSQGATQGIIQAAEFLLLLQFSRYLFIANGLSQIHFRWSDQVVAILRQQLQWFTPVFITLVLIVNIAEWQSEEIYRNTLGRAAFLAGMVMFVLFVHRLFRPNNGVLNQWQGGRRLINRPSHGASNQRGSDQAQEGRRLINRPNHGVFNQGGARLGQGWRRLIYLLMVGSALALMGFAFEGYYYVAYRLARLTVMSIMVGLGIFLFYSLAMRTLQVASRRFALNRAKARRRATHDARAAREAAEAAGEGLPEADLNEVSLADVNDQTRSLLSVVSIVLFAVAVMVIWQELMPAITRLDDVVIWQHLVTGPDGDRITMVSLLDIGFGLMTLVFTIAAAKNLPALLEITLLAPLALEKGNRYAVVSISRYLVYTVGATLIFGMLGLEWSDIQWLVAAMGVGIGFGLKEIFANLISGIIILFERPIRIGDTVTLGDVSGTVTRIRMRATTITDWDNKELIVPNQSFIIDPLINWTLSDQVTRIVIPVGVAYGSDTLLTHQIMSEVVDHHPDVMHDPNPTVFFIGFGDSSLDFEIRVFIKERVMRMPVQHELYMSLERGLRDAGIEIPFPQRDLHLRSVDSGIDLGGIKPA